jgi:hypothetical protein
MKIEGLKKEIEEKRIERGGKVQQIGHMQRELSLLDIEIKEIQKNIDNCVKIENVVVTDHAVIRYLERVNGLNIEEIRKDILSSGLIKFGIEYGSGKYSLNGFTAVLRDGKVVTITE